MSSQSWIKWKKKDVCWEFAQIFFFPSLRPLKGARTISLPPPLFFSLSYPASEKGKEGREEGLTNWKKKVEEEPDGTFKLTSVSDSSLNMYVQWNMSLEHHINVTIMGFFREFVTLVGLKVPSGRRKCFLSGVCASCPDICLIQLKKMHNFKCVFFSSTAFFFPLPKSPPLPPPIIQHPPSSHDLSIKAISFCLPTAWTRTDSVQRPPARAGHKGGEQRAVTSPDGTFAGHGTAVPVVVVVLVLAA